MNDDYCRLFGVTLAQVANRSVLDLVAERSRHDVVRKLRLVLKKKVPLLSRETDLASDRLIEIRWLDIPVMDCGGEGIVVEMIAVGEPLEK